MRLRTTIPVALREVSVVAATALTPTMRRICLEGEQLGALRAEDGASWPAFTTTGFDDDLRVILPYPGETEPVLPVIVDGQVTFAEGRRPLARAYTVRHFDARRLHLDIDIVLHATGVVSDWARTVRPGAAVHLAGPGVLHGSAPAGRPVVAVGDETALPALARLLEELPAEASGVVVAQARHLEYLDRPGRPRDVEVVALDPDDEQPAAAAFVAALDRLSLAPDAYVWIAGEQDLATTVRRHLVTARRVPREQVEFAGYWRRDVSPE